MHCPSCGFDNPEGMRFCGACGSPLTLRCPRCKSENPPGFSFCGQCGASLEEAPPPDVEAPAPPEGVLRSAPPEGERRQLTVMFCDLVGSTALSLDLDPEELRDVVQAYQRASVRVIERYEGYVAQYLGDGLLVYFGYPVAHEDEAERAVHAGLGILHELETLARRLQQERGIDLDVRIGIHTGVVVVGEMGGGGRREYLAMGEVPNVAARVQSIAQPGSLVVSETTYRLAARGDAVRMRGSGTEVAQRPLRDGPAVPGRQRARPRQHPWRFRAGSGGGAYRTGAGRGIADGALGPSRTRAGAGGHPLRRARHRQVIPRAGVSASSARAAASSIDVSLLPVLRA